MLAVFNPSSSHYCVPALNDSTRKVEAYFNELSAFTGVETFSYAREKKAFLADLESIQEDYSEANWDGYGASPLSLKSLAYARYFIEHVCELWGVSYPDLCPEPDGSLGMEWNGNGNTLIVSISSDAKLSYARLNKSQGIRSSGTYPYRKNKIPRDLYPILSELKTR
jgi:hypothetical protein